jgi:hypothetical protein
VRKNIYLVTSIQCLMWEKSGVFVCNICRRRPSFASTALPLTHGSTFADAVAEFIKIPLGGQRRKMGGAGLAMGPALEPCGESVDIHRRHGGEVLEASFRQPYIPAMTQPKGADALSERPFNAGTLRIFGLPFCGVLTLPERLQRLVFAPGFQGHMARVGPRFSTLSTRLTGPTVLISELDTHDRIVPPIAPCAPR